ncbi:MAG: hypothetical protein [Cressdnaviricota sp.]|nr:MAG: hypothetical protein [Cressdnaviricota sp.]
MAYKKTARQVEKKVFGTGGFKRRYGIGKGKGGIKIDAIAKDLMMIKSRLNSEKKEKREVEITSGKVGQVFGDLNGYWFQDITPTLGQGTGADERVGNSLKMTGCNLNFQFMGQQNTLTGRKIKIGLYRVRDPSLGPTDGSTDIVTDVFDSNPLTGLFDFNAAKAYRNSKNDGIACIREKTVYLPKIQQLGTQTDRANIDYEKAYKTLNFPVKLNDLLRYEQDNDNLPNGFRYVIVVRADVGNSSTTANSNIQNIPVVSGHSGVEFRMGQRWWYVDN